MTRGLPQRFALLATMVAFGAVSGTSAVEQSVCPHHVEGDHGGSDPSHDSGSPHDSDPAHDSHSSHGDRHAGECPCMVACPSGHGTMGAVAGDAAAGAPSFAPSTGGSSPKEGADNPPRGSPRLLPFANAPPAAL